MEPYGARYGVAGVIIAGVFLTSFGTKKHYKTCSDPPQFYEGLTDALTRRGSKTDREFLTEHGVTVLEPLMRMTNARLQPAIV
jgi:hypothetical protein